jgi:general secretion pathway protein C
MMQLEQRDKRALIGGAVVVTAVLAYLLWPSGAANQSGVELVAADQRQGPPPAPPQPQMAVTPPVVTPPAPAQAVVPEGLMLTGVTGSGAIFGFADGNQRFVARGRDVAPGLTLQGVALRHVILAGGATSYRLGFGGVAVPIQAPVATAGAPPPQPAAPGAGGMGGAAPVSEAQRQMSVQYLSALEPRRAGERVTGWTIKPGAEIAAFAQAGLQPGDVLLTVNGEAVQDLNQVAELPQKIARSNRAEFGFERNGQIMTRALEGNPGR